MGEGKDTNKAEEWTPKEKKIRGKSTTREKFRKEKKGTVLMSTSVSIFFSIEVLFLKIVNFLIIQCLCFFILS